MKRFWTIWKYSLGSFNDEDTKPVEDQIAIIRTLILGANLICAILIMTNIILGWINDQNCYAELTEIPTATCNL